MRNQSVDQSADCRFSAAGSTAEENHFTVMDRQRQVMQSALISAFVSEIDIFDFDHIISPEIF
jgi:hypothetical protein